MTDILRGAESFRGERSRQLRIVKKGLCNGVWKWIFRAYSMREARPLCNHRSYQSPSRMTLIPTDPPPHTPPGQRGRTDQYHQRNRCATNHQFTVFITCCVIEPSWVSANTIIFMPNCNARVGSMEPYVPCPREVPPGPQSSHGLWKFFRETIP